MHRNELEDSQLCGCFYCLQTFPPSKIEEWVDNEQTALCPECGIDSVIGDKSNYPITKEFLQGMNKIWF
ncbi:cytoplasmic protein [Paenisporosarcina quisquiliarum]|uniref:Cytoplasmic protein n=2 Tax=Paenisporosarcina quisquiliarum TaxID=365346 RepID=A0A9X3RCW7_9BACL|nr:cytoplasmic protein [Paenisporosarcina quisquiliarum]MCZ8537225.1 cytoplasmic protein [Paenisporosarcina quisquiliarum]